MSWDRKVNAGWSPRGSSGLTGGLLADDSSPQAVLAERSFSFGELRLRLLLRRKITERDVLEPCRPRHEIASYARLLFSRLLCPTSRTPSVRKARETLSFFSWNVEPFNYFCRTAAELIPFQSWPSDRTQMVRMLWVQGPNTSYIYIWEN